jgi:hypothetical protein
MTVGPRGPRLGEGNLTTRGECGYRALPMLRMSSAKRSADWRTLQLRDKTVPLTIAASIVARH